MAKKDDKDILKKTIIKEEIEKQIDLRSLLNTCEYTTATSDAYAMARFAEPISTLQHLVRLVEDMHVTMVNTLPQPKAAERLMQVLEERQCPVEDCKVCAYYQPGNVDKCNVNRAIADYLIANNYVTVVRPKDS